MYIVENMQNLSRETSTTTFNTISANENCKKKKPISAEKLAQLPSTN